MRFGPDLDFYCGVEWSLSPGFASKMEIVVARFLEPWKRQESASNPQRFAI